MNETWLNMSYLIVYCLHSCGYILCSVVDCRIMSAVMFINSFLFKYVI